MTKTRYDYGAIKARIFILCIISTHSTAVHLTHSFTRSVYVVSTLIKNFKDNTGLFYLYDGGENSYK